MYSEELIQRLNAIADDYREILERSVKTALDRYKNTGRGEASVEVTVISGDANKAPVIKINFEDYLIILDKRKVQWTKLPEINNLVEWANTKTTDERGAKQLAWAVAWTQKKFDKWKPKAWRKKGLSGSLKEMNARILKEFDEAIDEELQKSTKV